MRALTVSTIAAAILFVSPVVGQSKIATVEDYTKVMKSNAQLGGAMNKALAAPSYPEARKALASVRENFVTLQAFWTERKLSDATDIVKGGLTQIDALDKLLADEADLETVRKASMEFGRTTCAACHRIYREGDDKTGFRFKPGVFPK